MGANHIAKNTVALLYIQFRHMIVEEKH